MKVFVSTTSLAGAEADALIVGLAQGATAPADLDEAVGGLLTKVIEAGDFKANFAETLVLYQPEKKIVLLGLGDEAELDARRTRQAAAAGARAAEKAGAKRLASNLYGAAKFGERLAAQLIVDGTLHGLYKFKGYKSSEPEQAPVAEFALTGATEAEAAAAGAKAGQIIAEAANWARDLSNEPGNKLTATGLAEAAKAMAAEVGLEVEILEEADMKAKGLNLLLAVNQGSTEPPKCIILRYKGTRGGGKKLGLVGKGLVFDSGGLSLKPWDGMWDMKHDMSGGAIVLGAMRAIAQLKPEADVVAVVPATDNLPDGNSFKPGDVIQGYSGKTVEIRSTDAEGRLILADGLAVAVKDEQVDHLVEASTLTGAVLIALGKEAYGMVANDDTWLAEVQKAGEAAGERGWALPNFAEYKDLFKSQIADMTNGGGRYAGTIQGGQFLIEHVGDTPLVHLDIAGTSWQDKGVAHEGVGATAHGLRTLVEVALNYKGE